VKVRFATVSPKTNAAVIGATVKTIGAQQRRCIWLKFLIGEPMSAGGFCPAIWSPRWQASRARQGRGRPRLFSSWHSAYRLAGVEAALPQKELAAGVNRQGAVLILPGPRIRIDEDFRETPPVASRRGSRLG